MAITQYSVPGDGAPERATTDGRAVKNRLDKANAFFELSLTLRSRVLILVAVIARYLWLLSRLLRGIDPEAADVTKLSSGL